MWTREKRLSSLLAGALALLACGVLALSGAALADHSKGHKGDKGGGGSGGGEPLTGTVYFGLSGVVHTMNPDGSAKTALSATVHGEPSEALHGGYRWFLYVDSLSGVYPDGDQRQELFAVRDDGVGAVQLTDQANLEVFPGGRWTPGATGIDGLVSWTAVRWDLSTGLAVEAGIYEAVVDFDGNNVVGLITQPISPIVELPIFQNAVDRDGDGDFDEFNHVPDAMSFDWSPDTTMIVSDSQTFPGLLVADLLHDPLVWLPITGGPGDRSPDWSSDDSNKIVFESVDGIETINADGSGQTLVLENRVARGNRTSFVQLSSPAWSPSGSHFVYQRFDTSSGNTWYTSDVSRAQADGGQKTNLTKDTDAYAVPLAWR